MDDARAKFHRVEFVRMTIGPDRRRFVHATAISLDKLSIDQFTFYFVWKMRKLTVECDVDAANRIESTRCHSP